MESTVFLRIARSLLRIEAGPVKRPGWIAMGRPGSGLVARAAFLTPIYYWAGEILYTAVQGVVTTIGPIVSAATGVTICDLPKLSVTPWPHPKNRRDAVTVAKFYRDLVTVLSCISSLSSHQWRIQGRAQGAFGPPFLSVRFAARARINCMRMRTISGMARSGGRAPPLFSISGSATGHTLTRRERILWVSPCVRV